MTRSIAGGILLIAAFGQGCGNNNEVPGASATGSGARRDRQLGDLRRMIRRVHGFALPALPNPLNNPQSDNKVAHGEALIVTSRLFDTEGGINFSPEWTVRMAFARSVCDIAFKRYACAPAASER